MNRRQAEIATARAIGAVVLKVVEEGAEQGNVQVGDGQRRRRLFQSLLCEPQQEAEGVAVGGNGVRTHLALAHEPIREEGFQ
jgi:hypothetical protein